MALKLTVRMGGASGASTVDYTSQLRLWEVSDTGDNTPLLDAGMKYEDGASCQWQFVLDDDSNEIPKADLTKNLPAHTVVTVSEDAPGYEAWLARGRIADKEAYRGDLEMGDAIAWSVTADDANSDLKGLALTAPWVRTAESGRARVLALLAAFCNGSPRPSTVISTAHLVAAGGEVTMPAKTYPAGTDLTEIIDDCRTTEGKQAGVVIHHLSSASHLCFLYIDEADHSTYASTLSITDSSPNLTTSFPPIWDQGAAKIEEGQELATGVVLTYGPDNYVVDLDSGDATSYDYWVVPVNDSFSESAAQAATRAGAIREAKSREHVTHQVTIQLRANQVDLLCAGMSINIRSAASMGGQYLGTTQTRRIAQLKWEPIAPEVGAVDGYYLAHMQLDRPVRLVAAGKGTPPIFNPPATDFAPLALIGAACDNSGINVASDHPAWSGDYEERVEITASQNVEAGHSMVAVTAFNQTFTPDDVVYDERGNTWTLVAEQEHVASSVDDTVQIWYCNVTTAIQAGDYIRFAFNLGPSLLSSVETSGRCIGVYSYSGALSSPVAGTGSVATTASPLATTAGTGGLEVVGVSFQPGGATITGDGDWTAMIPTTNVTGSGDDAKVIYAQHLVPGSQTTWNATASQAVDWAAISARFTTSQAEGATSQPPGEAAPGTDNGAAREDHVHPPGIVSSTAPTVNDDSGDGHEVGLVWVDQTTDTAYVLVDDTVGAAVWQEIGNASDALTKVGGEKHTVNTVAASGTTETLNLADGNLHDVTLTDNCTFTFSGATNGVGCYLTLILRQDATGNRTVTWPASVEWPDDTAPTLSTAANAVDILSFLSNDGGTTWFGAFSGSVTASTIQNIGHWETIVSGSSPPVAVTNEAADDWLVGWVDG